MAVKTIGTHSGTFHADDCLAVYMLRLLPEFKDSKIVRSRDPEILETCDIIVDVHGKYDGVKYFDHHQRCFNETFSENFRTKLSSSGLIFKHFGKRIISYRLDLDLDHPYVDVLYVKLYESFLEAIDANDNGINAYPYDVRPLFKTQLELSSLVANFNPWWNQPTDDNILFSKFLKASEFIGAIFLDHLDYYGKAWIVARELVLDAFKKRFEYDSKGRIVVFEQFLPWKSHLFQIESEFNTCGQILYVIYTDGKDWRVQAVPIAPESFTSRKGLPENWRGLRDKALCLESNIDNCVFVHASGFTGGNKTKEGALQMAIKALGF
ncbi:unnamed protein product [Pneumocystis jirovecii]|uniref:Metal-dependent protein hydrolase n=2 Tax=Pneumocystis jirovecii TaxID=42068 RepID=L0PFZ0_PNEJI|nr:uncharacterized protein T551_02524 [Pneumocystis jirovecii RU7]KTW28674.1 hypothetical protein T551_02524 [Pneumocystis jirovecii RU7]CCJ28230.1 unnamed protein product [Pneumocystis jirovecii]CCJ31157.1 unnamed protein product [Pneumocystis jirovecii]